MKGRGFVGSTLEREGGRVLKSAWVSGWVGGWSALDLR